MVQPVSLLSCNVHLNFHALNISFCIIPLLAYVTLTSDLQSEELPLQKIQQVVKTPFFCTG